MDGLRHGAKKSAERTRLFQKAFVEPEKVGFPSGTVLGDLFFEERPKCVINGARHTDKIPQ
jgi:hypothetical protein